MLWMPAVTVTLPNVTPRSIFMGKFAASSCVLGEWILGWYDGLFAGQDGHRGAVRPAQPPTSTGS
jgi:hypothetical protein